MKGRTFQLLRISTDHELMSSKDLDLLKMRRKDLICILSHDVFEDILSNGGFALVEVAFSTEDVPIGVQQQAEAYIISVPKDKWLELREEEER